VSRVTSILRAAQCNKAPFMYEMKGALSGYGPGSASFPASRLRVRQSPGLTVPDRLVSQPPRSRSTGRPASLFRFAQLPRFSGLPVRPVAQVPRNAGSPGFPDSPAPHAARRCQAPAVNTGFPAFPAPRGNPQMVPVSCGESISTALRPRRARACRNSFKVFSCPHVLHKIPRVIRTSRRLSTAICTATPQVTRRNAENTSA
jgi:hypothetical protein